MNSPAAPCGMTGDVENGRGPEIWSRTAGPSTFGGRDWEAKISNAFKQPVVIVAIYDQSRHRL